MYVDRNDALEAVHWGELDSLTGHPLSTMIFGSEEPEGGAGRRGNEERVETRATVEDLLGLRLDKHVDAIQVANVRFSCVVSYDLRGTAASEGGAVCESDACCGPAEEVSQSVLAR